MTERRRRRRAAVLAAAALVLLAALVLTTTAWRRGGAERRAPPATPPPPPLDPPDPADAALFRRMADLVEPHGYPLEMAAVRTTDGHRSLLFRIAEGRRTQGRQQQHQHQQQQQQQRQQQQQQQNKRTKRRPALLLQHGLLGSSADFVLNGPEESLAFVLADAGFDVFLANSRGNEYGRGGVAGGGATSAYFWQWSWDEMAAFDLPAAVAAVLHLSGQSSLSLVAFSQGTTVALAALAAGNSMLPPRSIRQALLLGPVAYATHVDSVPLQRLADLGTDQALLLLGAREFSPSGELLRRLSGDLCSSAPELCVSALTAICGFNAYNADPARIPRYLNYTPSGTSTQNMAHWAQAVRGGGRGGGGGLSLAHLQSHLDYAGNQ